MRKSLQHFESTGSGTNIFKSYNYLTINITQMQAVVLHALDALLHQDQVQFDKVYVVLVALFRNKRFALNEMFQQNASKFAIYHV